MSIQNTTRQTAEQAYTQRTGQVEKMLERLNDRLANHKKDQACNSKSWGYAGDLQRIEELLAEAVAALGGMGERELRKRNI